MDISVLMYKTTDVIPDVKSVQYGIWVATEAWKQPGTCTWCHKDATTKTFDCCRILDEGGIFYGLIVLLIYSNIFSVIFPQHLERFTKRFIDVIDKYLFLFPKLFPLCCWFGLMACHKLNVSPLNISIALRSIVKNKYNTLIIYILSYYLQNIDRCCMSICSIDNIDYKRMT